MQPQAARRRSNARDNHPEARLRAEIRGEEQAVQAPGQPGLQRLSAGRQYRQQDVVPAGRAGRKGQTFLPQTRVRNAQRKIHR